MKKLNNNSISTIIPSVNSKLIRGGAVKPYIIGVYNDFNNNKDYEVTSINY